MSGSIDPHNGNYGWCSINVDSTEWYSSAELYPIGNLMFRPTVPPPSSENIYALKTDAFRALNALCPSRSLSAGIFTAFGALSIDPDAAPYGMPDVLSSCCRFDNRNAYKIYNNNISNNNECGDNNAYGGGAASAVAPIDDNDNNKYDDDNNNVYGGGTASAVAPIADDGNNIYDDNDNNVYGGGAASAVAPMDDNDNNKYGGVAALAVAPIDDTAENKYDDNVFITHGIASIDGNANIVPVARNRNMNLDLIGGISIGLLQMHILSSVVPHTFASDLLVIDDTSLQTYYTQYTHSIHNMAPIFDEYGMSRPVASTALSVSISHPIASAALSVASHTHSNNDNAHLNNNNNEHGATAFAVASVRVSHPVASVTLSMASYTRSNTDNDDNDIYGASLMAYCTVLCLLYSSKPPSDDTIHGLQLSLVH